MTTQVEPSAGAFSVDSNTSPVVVPAPAVPAAPKFYTEEEYAAAQSAARAQEKEKLYPELKETKTRLQELESQLTSLSTAKEGALKAEADAKAAAERAKQEAELDAKTLLELRTNEFNARLTEEANARENAFALLNKEREFSALNTYKQNLIEAERVNIIPQLIDLVSGNNEAEVYASVESLKERSALIFQDATTALQNQNKGLRGVSVTAPTSGPLDNNSGTRTFSPDDIKNMSMKDFEANRHLLMSSAAQGRTTGLFGN